MIAAQMPETTPPPGMVVAGNISSAFLQLAYPWLKTSGSGALLESLEPPDGVLTGMLARNALTSGTFTSATKIVPAEVYDLSPRCPHRRRRAPAQHARLGLAERQAQGIDRAHQSLRLHAFRTAAALRRDGVSG